MRMFLYSMLTIDVAAFGFGVWAGVNTWSDLGVVASLCFVIILQDRCIAQ